MGCFLHGLCQTKKERKSPARKRTASQENEHFTPYLKNTAQHNGITPPPFGQTKATQTALND